MPSRSQKQRRKLYAKFGAAWVKRHHFNKVVPKRKKRRGRKRRRRR